MRIFIISKAAWNIPALLVDQTVVDMVASVNDSTSSEIIVVADGFRSTLPPGATLMGTEEAEALLLSSANDSIVHFGIPLKGSESFTQYFMDLSAPKQLVDGWIANSLAQMEHKKIVKKVSGVYSYIDLPKPHLPKNEWSELALAKTRNTNGDSYFMVFATLNEIVGILKEFSIFKKWQQTSMAILFVCKDSKEMHKAEELVKGYKYRNAVFFKTYESLELIDFAAAYVSIWSVYLPYYTRMIQWAAGMGLPILLNSQTNWPIAYTQSGECFDFTELQGLSNHFKLYYKDEVYKQTRSNYGHAWLNQMMSDVHTIKNGIFAQ
jgi:hypothetical protein